MTGYEYIQVPWDFGDIEMLNSLASQGWRLVYAQPFERGPNMALLERPLTPEGQAEATAYYAEKGAPR